jgi:hypothetical protein
VPWHCSYPVKNPYGEIGGNRESQIFLDKHENTQISPDGILRTSCNIGSASPFACLLSNYLQITIIQITIIIIMIVVNSDGQ